MESVTDSDDYTSEDKKRKHAESLSPFKAVKKLNRTPQKKSYKGDIEERGHQRDAENGHRGAKGNQARK
nr:unnamed protein product [Callosobruchus analis]